MDKSSRTQTHQEASLRAALPKPNSPYELHRLSPEEAAAFVEALGDGFGDTEIDGAELFPLPEEVSGGLLRHSHFVNPNQDLDEIRFWSSGDDRPPPYTDFPLDFSCRRLRIYFENQFARFCEHIRKEEGLADLDPVEDRWFFEHCASRELYQKPWYEHHALILLEGLEEPHSTGNLHFEMLIRTYFAGRLGRLVEQYYWRLHHEPAAITGDAARRGASAGGLAKAKIHKAEYDLWQKAASEIEARRPKLGKNAVAALVKAQTRSSKSVKHIARMIKLSR